MLAISSAVVGFSALARGLVIRSAAAPSAAMTTRATRHLMTMTTTTTPATVVGKDVGKLTYLNSMVRSRGEPTQICAAYGGVGMEVELVPYDVWESRKGKIAPFLPYITQPDGSVLIETLVIMKHLAEVGGKFVIDEKTEKLCEIANSAPIVQADNIFNLPGGGGVGEKAGDPKYDEWFKGTAEVLKEYVVQLGDGPFFAGEKPGYGEAFVFHNLDNCFDIDKAAFTDAIGEDGMAKLTAFYGKFAALDGVKEYLAGRPKAWGLPGSRANPA